MLAEDSTICALADALAPRCPVSGGDGDDAPPGKRCRVLSSESSDGSDQGGSPTLRPPAPATESQVASQPSGGLRIASSDSESECDARAEDAVGHGPKRWMVGLRSGLWIHQRHAPLEEQSQVLLGNVVANLSRLPIQLAKTVHRTLWPKCEDTRKTGGGSWRDTLCSAVLAIPRQYMLDAYQKLRHHKWVPAEPFGRCPRRSCQNHHGDSGPIRSEGGRNLAIMKVLVREALALSSGGGNEQDYERAVARLVLHGVDVGDKYHVGSHICPDVEILAMQMVRSAVADALRTPLRGTGIASCASIVADTVSIGARNFSRHETLCIVGWQHAHPISGRLMCTLVAIGSQGARHSGEHTKDLMAKLLEGAPLNFSRKRMRQIVVVIGGDGAMTIGGEDHKHQSTSTCELLYRWIFPQTLPGQELTHWDLFHRDETAGTWATKQSGLAVEVLDVAQVVLQLFGVGQGRVLFRGIAEFLNDGSEHSYSQQGSESNRTLKPAEGHAATRPLAHGFKTAETLYRNYRVIHLGLEARTAQARGVNGIAKQGSQTIEKMVGVARRVCAIDFVTFLVLYRDLHSHTLKPFANRTQDPAAEAVEMQLACNATMEKLRHAQDTLVVAKRLLYVMVLATGYIGPDDVTAFWSAHRFSRVGRVFPSWLRHIGEIVWNQRFQGCGLVYVPGPSEADGKHWLVHPRCQCGTMRTRPPRVRLIPRVVRRPCACYQAHCKTLVCKCASGTMVSNEPDKSRLLRTSVKIRRQGVRHTRAMLVPEWTGETFPGRADAIDGPLLSVAPRFALRPLESAAPIHLQGVSRWNTNPRVPRCRYTATSFLGRYLQVVVAFDAATKLLEALLSMLGCYFGSRGANKTMRDLLHAISVFWDWDALLKSMPTKETLHALLDALRILRPSMEFTLWPPPGCFAYAERKWPTDNQMLKQFVLLRRRVVRRLGKASFKRKIMEPVSAVVAFVPRPAPHIYLALWPRFRTRTGRRATGRSRILVLVAAFMFPSRSCEAALMRVRVAELYVPGLGYRLDRRCKRARPSLLSVGSVLGLLTPGFEGQLARVLSAEHKVNLRQLAASFDTDPTWHAPDSGHHCYHMILVGHRLRFLLPPETCVESWGGQLHHLYRAQNNLRPWRYSARLFLAEQHVQCTGGVHDEALVHAIAEYFVDELGKKPVRARSFVAARCAPTALAVRQRDRSSWPLAPTALSTSRAELVALQEPTALDPALGKHLASRFERAAMPDSSGVVRPLRSDTGAKLVQAPAMAKLLLKDVTRSVFRERLVAWLATPSAAEWKRQRAAMGDPDAQVRCSVATWVPSLTTACVHVLFLGGGSGLASLDPALPLPMSNNMFRLLAPRFKKKNKRQKIKTSTNRTFCIPQVDDE